ncbi:MAG: HDOD domain-containing protein [Phycisphaerales bacterium JB037]
MSQTPTGDDARQQVVQSAIREISHIATLPEITVRIVELVEDPKSTAQDLHEVISQDPALSSRILKVVNSSFYGLPGQIGSINRAIVMLGLNAVKNIAIAASLVKLFRGGDLTKQISAKDIWDHSSYVAAASKMIADQLKLGLGDEAYLAGLTHEIGMVVEMQFDRDKLIRVLEGTGCDSQGVPVNDMRELELQVFGATHEDFGKALCEAWKFPRTFAQVAGHHHNPLGLPAESRTLACIVHVADRLAAEIEGTFRADLPDTTISQDVLDELNLTQDRVEAVRKKLAETDADSFQLAA